MKNYRAELVGVLGYPVDGNPTIAMFEAGFKELGLFYRYLTVKVLPEDLEEAMRGVRAFNMKGVHLTMPHKVEVCKYLDEFSEAAGIMGAVNTVIRKGDKLFGENTDGKGFMTSIVKEGGFDPKGKKVVILGAGGAARAITVELALAGVANIKVVNVTEKRGKDLVDVLNAKTNAKAEYVKWEGDYKVPEDTDLFIDGTSIGMAPDLTALAPVDYDSIKPHMLACDVVHLPTTPFLEEAKKRGAKTVDGLGMLVYQGAVTFKHWTGEDAPIPAMTEAISVEFGLK